MGDTCTVEYCMNINSHTVESYTIKNEILKISSNIIERHKTKELTKPNMKDYIVYDSST